MTRERNNGTEKGCMGQRQRPGYKDFCYISWVTHVVEFQASISSLRSNTIEFHRVIGSAYPVSYLELRVIICRTEGPGESHTEFFLMGVYSGKLYFPDLSQNSTNPALSQVQFLVLLAAVNNQASLDTCRTDLQLPGHLELVAIGQESEGSWIHQFVCLLGVYSTKLFFF